VSGAESRLAKLRRQRERHKQRSLVVRVAVALSGFATVAGGVALLVLPGPGIPLLLVGLGLLALEFDWAEAALARMLEKTDRAAQLARGRSRRTKAAGVGTAVTLAAALVVGVAVWGLPGLPF
jgi:uncharacterized protein (TIGR02611 family)